MTRSSFWLSLLLLVTIAAAAIQTNISIVHAYTPGQRDAGARVYSRWCSTCHGDKGQGLTPEWRQTWPEDHQNCSLPKCHGPQHPPTGFEIKNNYVPALIGPGTLSAYHTAQDLFDYISRRMPIGAPSLSGQEDMPGMLSQDEEWALTAFLLAAHGVPADDVHLDATTAGQVNLAESSIAPEELPQQAWWEEMTPVSEIVTSKTDQPATPPGAIPSASEDTSMSQDAAVSAWWPAVAGVGLAIVLIGLTAVVVRQRGR